MVFPVLTDRQIDYYLLTDISKLPIYDLIRINFEFDLTVNNYFSWQIIHYLRGLLFCSYRIK